MNVAVLWGTLSSDPTERVLPSGTRLMQYEVTTESGDDGPAASAPVVWIDPPTRLPSVGQGDQVVVVGHVRRRFFRTATGITASRTEVVADRVLPPRPASRLERVLGEACARLSAPS